MEEIRLFLKCKTDNKIIGMWWNKSDFMEICDMITEEWYLDKECTIPATHYNLQGM